MAAVLYCTPDQVKERVSGTDAGSGTAARLTTDQLTQACTIGSDRVSAYSGTVWDATNPPAMVADLALDIAVYFATLTYYKSKPLPPGHPAALAYASAMAVLADVRDDKIRIDPQPAGGVSETGVVINPNPGRSIFTQDDSNTEWSSQGILEAQGGNLGSGRLWP